MIIQMIVKTVPMTSMIQETLPKASIAASRPTNNTNRMPTSRMIIKRRSCP